MALAIGCGSQRGAFAPTSLFGIVSYGTARGANIELRPFTLFAVAVGANLALLLAAAFLFGGRGLAAQLGTHSAPSSPRTSAAGELTRPTFGANQIATLVCLAGIIAIVIGASIAGLDPDIGVLCFVFGAVLALVDPKSGTAALSKIDWSTVLLVGGVITFVGVLQTMGSVALLGEAAKFVGVPLLAAFVICLIGALVSAFASTTGILAALVPLAVPLVASGELPGWALISALAVCASLVDVSPFFHGRRDSHRDRCRGGPSAADAHADALGSIDDRHRTDRACERPRVAGAY
jgi:Na+/H+ antiporter NhaD/arsenite permease-like protein